jgi:hypothetical protein
MIKNKEKLENTTTKASFAEHVPFPNFGTAATAHDGRSKITTIRPPHLPLPLVPAVVARPARGQRWQPSAASTPTAASSRTRSWRATRSGWPLAWRRRSSHPWSGAPASTSTPRRTTARRTSRRPGTARSCSPDPRASPSTTTTDLVPPRPSPRCDHAVIRSVS